MVRQCRGATLRQRSQTRIASERSAPKTNRSVEMLYEALQKKEGRPPPSRECASTELARYSSVGPRATPFCAPTRLKSLPAVWFRPRRGRDAGIAFPVKPDSANMGLRRLLTHWVNANPEQSEIPYAFGRIVRWCDLRAVWV